MSDDPEDVCPLCEGTGAVLIEPPPPPMDPPRVPWMSSWKHCPNGCELWRQGEPQPPTRREMIANLKQALWDIYGILGFDQDGDRTPGAQRDLIGVVVAAAREARAQWDADNKEVDRLERRWEQLQALLTRAAP